MKDTFRISEAKLGETVLVDIFGDQSSYIKSDIIGCHRDSNICLGWKEKPVTHGYLIVNGALRDVITISNIEDYTYMYWVGRNCLCKKYIFNENQKCIECNKKCPHAEPNQENKTYLCFLCKSIKELSI